MKSDLMCSVIISKLLLFITVSTISLTALSLAKESLSMTAIMISIIALLLTGVTFIASHNSLYKWSIWDYIVMLLYLVIILEVLVLSYMYTW